jgi:hypothetical protein
VSRFVRAVRHLSARLFRRFHSRTG